MPRCGHAAQTLLVFCLAWASTSLRAQDARLEHALAPRWIDGERVHAWPRKPLLSEARAQIGVPWVWSERGALGEGASVCIVDTGIDLNHRDFLDEAGATRVRFLLDLDAPPRGVHGELERGGGAVWSGDEINAARAASAPLPTDWHGHGTVVASAAAGDDSADAEVGAEAGVAPRASLVVVRALRRNTLGIGDDDIARGASFCASVLEPSRSTIVIALGGHDGPHDGSSALERALTRIARRGFSVVVAAGNDGQRAIHASARLIGEEAARFSLRVPAPEIPSALVAVVVHGARAVRLLTPDGQGTPWVERGETHDDGVLQITRGSARGDLSTTVLMRGQIPFGVLTIEARGAEVTPQGRAPMAHAWLAESEVGSIFPTRFEGETARQGEEVTVPATADGVIAVGASVSRGFVRNGDGPGLTAEQDEDGRARYSARGPRLDGAPLPHVLAPGGWVSAALSLDLEIDNPDALFGGSRARFEAQRRGDSRVMALGTSISAGVLGGAIAIARGLAQGGDRDTSMLLATARSESAWRATSGMGIVDMEAWLRMREGDLGAESLAVSCTRGWIAPSANNVRVVARTNSPSPRSLSLFAHGPRERIELGSLNVQDGVGVAVLDTPAWAASEVLVEVREGDVVRGRCALQVTLDGSPHAPRALGGCSASRGRTPFSWALLGLLFFSLTRARGRRSA